MNIFKMFYPQKCFKQIFFSNKNRLAIFALLQVFLCGFVFAMDGIREEIPQGFAKIRIWDTDFRNLEAGHVSLQTQNSYISFWPLSTDSSTTHFSVPITKQGDNNTLVRQAPGLSVINYEQDLELENRRPPDHNYFVRVNNEHIEIIWNNVKALYGEIIENGVKFEFIRWYAPGRSDLGLTDTTNTSLYCNCASMVMLALAVGGVEESHISSVFSEKELWTNLAEGFGHLLSSNRHDQQSQQMGLFLKNNHKLAGSIIPMDIKSILDKKIKADLEVDLRKSIKSDRIIPKCDIDLAYSKMAEELVNLKSQLYKVNRQIYADLIINVGKYNLYGDFVLSESILQKIQEIERNRTIALTTLAGAGVVIVGVQAAKGNCIMM